MSTPVPPFRYRQPETRIFGGDGALAQVPSEVKRSAARRVLAVCGRTVATNTDLLDRLRELLGDRLAGVFDRVEARSPLPVVKQGVETARATDADGLIAIGGGSAVVTARGIAILATESGDPHELATQYPEGSPPLSPRLDAPKPPIFLVLTTPTTAMARAGTALMDMERHHRLEFFDPKTRAAAIFLDPQALLTASVDLTRSAAVSAYTGLVTGLATTSPNPISDGDRRAAVELLTSALPRLDAEPRDGALRLELAVAAYLSNRASEVEQRGGAGFGILAALAHSIDTRYASCGHGEAYAVALPAALRFNLDVTRAEQARLAKLLGTGDDPESAAERVAAFLQGIGMPARLRDVGVPEEELPLIARDAMEDFNLHRNARPVTAPDDLMPLLRSMW